MCFPAKNIRFPTNLTNYQDFKSNNKNNSRLHITQQALKQALMEPQNPNQKIAAGLIIDSLIDIRRINHRLYNNQFSNKDAEGQITDSLKIISNNAKHLDVSPEDLLHVIENPSVFHTAIPEHFGNFIADLQNNGLLKDIIIDQYNVKFFNENFGQQNHVELKVNPTSHKVELSDLPVANKLIMLDADHVHYQASYPDIKDLNGMPIGKAGSDGYAILYKLPHSAAVTFTANSKQYTYHINELVIKHRHEGTESNYKGVIQHQKILLPLILEHKLDCLTPHFYTKDDKLVQFKAPGYSLAEEDNELDVNITANVSGVTDHDLDEFKRQVTVLHELGFAHGDLSATNIFYGGNSGHSYFKSKLRLIDFDQMHYMDSVKISEEKEKLEAVIEEIKTKRDLS